MNPEYDQGIYQCAAEILQANYSETPMKFDEHSNNINDEKYNGLFYRKKNDINDFHLNPKINKDQLHPDVSIISRYARLTIYG